MHNKFAFQFLYKIDSVIDEYFHGCIAETTMTIQLSFFISDNCHACICRHA